MTGPTIVFERQQHAALCYHVLAHLDLGRDAASIRGRGDTFCSRPWVAPLVAAYTAAPGRLAVQVAALRIRDETELLATLLAHPPRELADEPGRTLCRRLAEAIRLEQAAFATAWRADTPRCEAYLRAAAAELEEILEKVRNALWERRDEPPPSLRVWDCPALGPHGRATFSDGDRIVAVSVDRSLDQVLCQILHEETHVITDPLVTVGWDGSIRDTRSGTPGHAAHVVLEQAAVSVLQAVLEARAPQYVDAYARWRARFNV